MSKSKALIIFLILVVYWFGGNYLLRKQTTFSVWVKNNFSKDMCYIHSSEITEYDQICGYDVLFEVGERFIELDIYLDKSPVKGKMNRATSRCPQHFISGKKYACYTSDSVPDVIFEQSLDKPKFNEHLNDQFNA